MSLTFIDACEDRHFRAMSLIHALGWRATYRDAVPADYMRDVITDHRWVDFFREDHKTGRCKGLLLYDGDRPVACCTYGPARGEDYPGWGEVISFYAHPEEKGKGYGSALMAEALRRLAMEDFSRCYLLVLRENENARRFYEALGFAWDGTHVDVPFPNGPVCVDLRYTRMLER